jgi:vacuolar iron transporter family protein
MEPTVAAGDGQASRSPARAPHGRGEVHTRGEESHGHSEAHGHHHRDVSGGWLRPAVFGSMDGLVTNVSLIAGVGGGGGSPHAIILAGLAGLSAGAFSMAAGEFVSVSSQNELINAEVRKEKVELDTHPEAELRELAAVFRHGGVEPRLADEVARQLSERPDVALRLHVREELGVDHKDLPSPFTAAGASLLTFAVGALIPLLPYLIGFRSLLVALVLAAVAAFSGGGLVARVTDRPFLRGALRQLLLAGAAAGLTYGIGTLVGHAVS